MRTQAERAWALLLTSGLPCFLWEEAMSHSNWLQNWTLAWAINGKTPYKMKNKRKPNLAGIQEFGVAAYVKDLKAGKLDTQAKKGRFVGYDSKSKGYRIYWPEKRSVTVEQNIVFNQDDARTSDDTAIIYGEAQSEGEKDKVIQALQNNNKDLEKPKDKEPEDQQTSEEELQPYQSPQDSNSIPFPSTDEPQPKLDSQQPDDNPPSSQQYGHGHRTNHWEGHHKAMNEGMVAAIAAFVKEDPDKLEDETNNNNEVNSLENLDNDLDDFYELPPNIALTGHYDTDPKTIDEALHGPNTKEWQEALEYKISQLEKLRTWEVVDLPKGETAIPWSKITRVKQGPNGEVQSYRVRIVAGGHKQIGGVNYTKTFSAAAKMPTVYVILANAAHQNWEIEHIDVKSAYLNAPLKEIIYMKPPRSVLKPGQEGKVLRLIKGLYGLKQAGRGWYLEMAGVFMNKMGFEQSKTDHSVFFQWTDDEHTIVAVATDDMAITSKRAMNIKWFKSKVKEFWDIKDYRPIKWFLIFQIKRDCKFKTISINQQAYIESVVEKFGLTNAKNVATPMAANAKFMFQHSPMMLNQVAHLNRIPYSEAIGSILWAMVVSRPDTAYAVGVLSQFIQNPGPAHWDGVKRVVSYLGSTKELWLTFGGTKETPLERYCNMDWTSQPHRHSISRYSFHYGLGTISWSFKKQNVITLSSTEAEYIVETHATKEGIWLKTFVKEVVGEGQGPLTIMGDNQGAIALAKDNKFHLHTKHINLHYYFIREAVQEKKVKMVYILTADNIANIFMKALVKPKFTRFIGMLGLAMIKEWGVFGYIWTLW
jgi:Reverse transcriptase (RNA-dependent DNA polymerase)